MDRLTKKGGDKVIRICCYVDKNLHRLLRLTAKKNGKIFSHFIREILEKEMERLHNGKNN